MLIQRRAARLADHGDRSMILAQSQIKRPVPMILILAEILMTIGMKGWRYQ